MSNAFRGLRHSIPTVRTDKPVLVSEILSRAADLIEKPGAWMKGWSASNGKGRIVGPEDRDARCWCAIGALIKVGGEERLGESRDALARALGFPSDKFMRGMGTAPVPHWNDAPDRTQAEVVEALREAAQQAALVEREQPGISRSEMDQALPHPSSPQGEQT